MKFRYLVIVAAFFMLIGGYIFSSDTVLGQNSSVNVLNPWKVVSGYILPRDASNGLQIDSLASSNDCLVTDATGKVSTATCGVGGGTTEPVYWLNNGTYVWSSTTASAPTFVATSSAATSSLPYLSVTGFKIGSDYITDLTGTGLTVSGNALAVSLANDYITPNMVLSTGQTDEYCLTYEATGSTWEWQPCGSGGSSSGWSTTTSSVAGQLNLYSLNETDIVNIGSNSTTTSEFWFDPNTVRMAVNGSNGTSSVVLGSSNNEWVLGTSDTDKSLRIASSTGLLDGATASFSIAKSGLLTFGNASSTQLSWTATSSGSNGINITSGCYAISGTCITGTGSTFSTSSADYWAQNSLQLGQLSDISTTSLAAYDVLYWTGSQWARTSTSSWDTDTDTNTTYTAGGTLLDLSGTTFSLNEGTLTNGKICTYVTGTGIECDYTDVVGSGGTGLATSTAIADTYVIYGTGVGTVGAESAFTYDDATDKLTVSYASTTALSFTNAYGTTAYLTSLLLSNWSVATSTVVCMAPETCQYQADGTADDVQIQAAIDYMDAIGGGTVHIKHGTYDITAPIDINADTGTYILGDGWGATILAANASMTTTDYVIDFTPSASGIYAKIQDLKINAGCHASGIDMEGAVESKVRDVHINNPYNWGIYINQGSGPYGHHNEVVGVLIDGGDSCSGIGQAIKIEGSDENYIAHSEFQYMGGSNASGTDATILDKAGLNTIQSNYFVHLAQRGIQIQDASKDVISGNTFDGVSGDNVYLNGASTVLSNNQFHSIGSTSAPVAVMLNFYDNNSVTGNVFNSHETDNYLASFIKTQAGSDNHTISNNVFIENGALTGSYLDISGSNNVLGNSNYTTNTIIGDLHIGNSTASGTQLYFYHTDGTQIGLDTYSFGGGEYGLSTPQLKLTDGRFDFDPNGGKAEFRVSGANTQFNIYNTNLGQYYMQMSADGSNVTSVVFPHGNVGIGTTSPYAKLSVNGQVVASHFTATTTSTSTFGGPAVFGGRTLQVGNPTEQAYVPSGGANSAFLILDKPNAASDASVLLGSAGDLKWEIGMAGDENLYWKKITGTEAGGYTFESLFKMDYSTARIGIGTDAPSSKLEIASTSPSARVDMRVTNKATSGTDGTSLQLVAENDGHVFYVGTDAGLNGGQNAFLNWGGFGTGLFIDASGNVAVQTTTIPAGAEFAVGGDVDVTGTTTTDKLDVTTAFDFLGDYITNVSTWFVSKLEAVTSATLTGTWNFTGATVKQKHYRSFTWPGFATTTTATTTVPVGSAGVAEQWNWMDCKVTASTGGVQPKDDSGNAMNFAALTTTYASSSLSTNNTFVSGEGRNIDVGPLTAAQVTCTIETQDS